MKSEPKRDTEETNRRGPYTICISLWFNPNGGSGTIGPDTNDLADPAFPELGYAPHAQKVMKAYGITYQKAQPSPISDSWVFRGCDKYPEVIQPWMSVFDADGAKINQQGEKT